MFDSFKTLLITVCAALFAPWTLTRRVQSLSPRAVAFVAAASLLVAAGLSTTLSAWTYVAGKGLLLTRYNELDLGQDDLPPDTIAQVAGGLAGSLAIWVCLLITALLVCVAAADVVYRRDRRQFRVAVRAACVASVWFVVWAAGVLVVNGVRQDEVRRPAAAIRAYAQLNQQGFRGSSAMAPGRPEREPLAGGRRLVPLAVVFPLIWAAGLRAPASPGHEAGSWKVIGGAVLLSWLAWWAVARLLPWITIAALAG